MTRWWREWRGLVAYSVALGFFIAGCNIVLSLASDDNPAPAPPTPTSEPFCDGDAAVYPGTGVVQWSERCEQPPVHAPEGTGPNVGPRGERE